jgi:hypothetical protein
MQAAKTTHRDVGGEVEKKTKPPAALAKYLGIESAEVYDHVFLWRQV